MEKLKIAGLGELLWDLLPDGEKIGGAPINFTYHATSLGTEALAISTIGDDTRGNRALRELEKHGVQTGGISKSATFPTGFVKAHIDAQGIASYSFPDDVAWDHLHINKYAIKSATELNALCFGTLAQRKKNARKTIHRFLKNSPESALKIYDLNLRQNFYSKEIIETSLQACNILKLNDDELLILSRIFNLSGNNHEQLAALLTFYHLDLVILTRGGKGSYLLGNGTSSDHPGIETRIFDTIGAGDSFTAAAVVGFLMKKNLDQINLTANTIASYICTQPGAMVKIPDRLKY